VYEVIFNIVHYGVIGVFITDPELYRDARFIGFLNVTKNFLKKIFEIHDKYRTSIFNIAHNVFDGVLHLLKHAKGFRYVVFCDGMSIVEALYIAYKMRAGFINVIINPGGVTETYKFLLGAEEYMARQPRLEEIVSAIARRAGASYIIFRGYDEVIHRLESSEGVEPWLIIDEMYNATLRLEVALSRLKREGATIVLLSDHGYDVVPLASGKFKTLHRWSSKSLSIIAPVLIIDPHNSKLVSECQVALSGCVGCE
jgi:rhodanese-related sulfurtransferase